MLLDGGAVGGPTYLGGGGGGSGACFPRFFFMCMLSCSNRNFSSI